MFKRILILAVFLLSQIFSFGQVWKTYPYTPAGSLVSFPVDEGRHSVEPIEWWYVSGHLTGQTTAKEYSYMLTYFYYPENVFDGFRILNITDESDGTFYQNVLPLNYTVLSTSELDIEASVFTQGIEYWRNTTDLSNDPIPFEYELSAASSNSALNLDLISQKHPLILGDDGFLNQGIVNYTYYYSLTSNAVTGSITAGGVTENVVGNGWIDRQYGNFNPLTGEKYEWFSLQLTNGMDINLWNIFTNTRTIPDTEEYRILSAYVDESTQYTNSNFSIERLEFFCTPDAVNCYSKSWRLTSDVNQLDLVLTANHTTTEVQLPFRFFEGSLDISGTVNGVAVTGKGFAELLHTYEDPQTTITYPTTTYDPSQAISWTLDNPDDGRPVFYDIEYSIDNQVNYLPLIQDLTTTNYTWNSSPLSNGQEVFFKIIAKSVDGVLIGESISPALETLGVSSLNQTTFKAVPNPTDGELHLHLNRAVAFNLDLIDLNGRTILSKSYNADDITVLNMKEFASGFYIIRVQSDERHDFIRVLKQ